MFILGCVLLVVAVILFVVSHFLLKGSQQGGDDNLSGRVVRIISFSLVGVGIIFLGLACITSVSSGNVGVPVIFGSVQNYYLPEGIHTINPFASVQEMSVRSQEYTMVSTAAEGQKEGDDSIFAQSKDGVVLQMNITVVYKLVDGDSPWVYRHLGPNYAESIVRSAARSSVPDSTSKYSFEEAYAEKREAMAGTIRERMNVGIQNILRQYPDFKGEGVTVQNVFIREVHPSAQLLKAIEDKMVADQQSQAMTFVLSKETQEAQRKKIEAGGIKDFQQIVTQGITPSLLEWKGIEATEKLANSQNAKVIVVGNGKGNLPVVFSGNQ